MSTPQKIVSNVVITGTLDVTERALFSNLSSSNVSASNFYGDGSGLVNVSASNAGVGANAVSGAITGALVPYATLSGVSASFTTPSQLTSALSPYALLVDISSSFVDNTELTNSITNFPTRTEVTGVLVNYPTLTNLSASFIDNTELTNSITNFPTRTEVTGVLENYATLSGLSASYANLTSSNTFSGSQTITGSLFLTQNIESLTGTIKTLGFEQVFNTTAPNGTVPVLGFMATGSQTNIDIVLGVKNQGALLRQIPNNAASGGNKRGNRAVDFSVVRDVATQIASAEASQIIGGQKNTNAGFISTINAGADCTISDSGCFIGAGSVNRIDAGSVFSFVGTGQSNRINTNSNNSVIVGGAENHTDAPYTAIGGGHFAITRGVIGRQSYASGRFATRGDAQIGTLVTRMSSSNGTPVILTSNGSGTPVGTAGSANVNVLPNNSAYKIRAEVVAREPTTGDSKAWTLECLVTRGANAASTAIDGTILSSSFGSNVSSSAWDATLLANTTRGSIEISCTGEVDKTIRWVGRMETTEVA